MLDAGVIESVLRAVEELGFLRSGESSASTDDAGTYKVVGEISVEGRKVKLRIELDRFFPLHLPSFYLEPWNGLGFIPHVEQSGKICYMDQEGMILDTNQPIEIIKHAFRSMMDTVTRGVLRLNEYDFVDEFGSYWALVATSANGNTLAAYSVLDAKDDIAEVVVHLQPQSNGKVGKGKKNAGNEKDESNAKGGENPILWIGRSELEINAFHNGHNFTKDTLRQSGIYVPLDRGTLFIPPDPDKPFWTAQEALKLIFSLLPQSKRRRLERLLKNRHRMRDYVIVSLPRKSEGVTYFGFRYDGGTGRSSLGQPGTGDKLVPIFITQIDRNYLLRRGGGSTALDAKKVLLVGCGALGGHLAFELARAGILDLTLVDSDELRAENSFRHVLGRQFWGKKKASALKEAIEGQLPYVQVTSVATSIERALEDGSVDLSTYDLVVLAIGNPTIELDINRRVHALSGKPAALFTWLEPLGIGGHALLTHNGLDDGCFECLYTSTETIGLAHNEASFAAENQFFGRSLSGCENMHTPYGSIDAVRTAALASRVAIDALTGREGGNPLLSWKGDRTAFTEAGFRLSERYTTSEQKLFERRYMYKASDCRVCGPHATPQAGS